MNVCEIYMQCFRNARYWFLLVYADVQLLADHVAEKKSLLIFSAKHIFKDSSCYPASIMLKKALVGGSMVQ